MSCVRFIRYCISWIVIVSFATSTVQLIFLDCSTKKEVVRSTNDLVSYRNQHFFRYSVL